VPYTAVMSSVAERMRQESRERPRAMTAAERMNEALALGKAAIVAYVAAHGVDYDEARRRLELSAQAGRRASRAMRELVG